MTLVTMLDIVMIPILVYLLVGLLVGLLLLWETTYWTIYYLIDPKQGEARKHLKARD